MTYNEYYEDYVVKIFSTVFGALRERPEYTYTVGDILFFRRYYDDLETDQERDQIRELVANG